MTATVRSICFTANTDWYLYNFRLDLARAAVRAGHTVSMVCPPGEYVSRLRAEGFEVRTFPAPSDGFSLKQNLAALRVITKDYKDLQPDLVHLFTPVCVLLGSLAAWRTNVPNTVAALTGLGHVFTTDSARARLVRPMMRFLFRWLLRRKGTAVIFQNVSDHAELIDAGIVDAERCHLVRGSGVDTHRFCPRAKPRPDDEVRILFASRLLGEKGITELLQAFEQIHAHLPNTRLWVAGDIYPPNPSSLTVDKVQALAMLPGVTFLGHVEDMPELLAQVDIVALPSWREGTPKILLEAAACGLPIVTTDIPGCQGLVEDGCSGFLVPVRDTSTLAGCLATMCTDPAKRLQFGTRGRQIVVEGFSSQKVIADTLAIYRELVGG
jgi:glycosyltransferase involved in cell wall biosynthesis